MAKVEHSFAGVDRRSAPDRQGSRLDRRLLAGQQPRPGKMLL